MTECWINVYEIEPGRHEIGVQSRSREDAERFAAYGYRIVYRLHVRRKVRG